MDRPTRQKVLELVMECVREVESERGATGAIGEGTQLLGPEAVMDSLGLVRLVAATEEAVASRHGATITLADERALSERNSPFRTVGSLTDFVMTALDAR